VDLVAVAAGRDRAVIADRDRQEVEHQVGVGHIVVAAREAAALEVVGGARAAAEEQPVGADPRPGSPSERRLDGDRLLAAVLDIHLEVILHVLAHARQVGHRVDTEALELVRVADTGKLEQLRC
jgi:hypothetical protein